MWPPVVPTSFALSVLTNFFTAAVWTGEGADMTESGSTFEQIKIADHELSTFVVASNKLIEDNTYNLEGELLADFAESFGKAEGLAFVKGTGTGQPRGLMTATGIQTINTGLAGGFPAANPADVLIGMYHRIPSAHAQNAVSQPKPSPKIGDDRQRHPRPRAALRQGLCARPPTPPPGTLPKL